jgi:hypothetical protein
MRRRKTRRKEIKINICSSTKFRAVTIFGQ